MRYDLIVLGHDRHGRLAALEAARFGKRVALVECHNDDAPPIPSLREAALQLARFLPRENSIRRCHLDRKGVMQQLRQLAHDVAQHEAISFTTQLSQHGADFIDGAFRFVGPNEVAVITHSDENIQFEGNHLLLAVGTKPNRPNWVPFDGRTILDKNELLALPRVPKSMIVVGAEIAALESAMFFAVLGTRVVFVDPQPRLLESWDREIVHRFRQQAERCGVRFRLGRQVQSIEKTPDARAVVQLENGKRLLAECVLYAAGSQGNTSSLNLSAAGLQPDEQGRLWCNELGQTWVKHIYGIGDVVGFPTLARAALGQCRRIVEHLCRPGPRGLGDSKNMPELTDPLGVGLQRGPLFWNQSPNYPTPTAHGLLGITELAMVGATEEQLRDDLVAYEVGVAKSSDDSTPTMLKLLFHRESLELLGVHCLSKSATELIRLGQTVMSLKGTIESFRDRDFGDTPLTACYRYAAENGLSRLADESLTDRRLVRSPLRSRKSPTKQHQLAFSPRRIFRW